jgi:hypothetical protein
VSVVNVEVVLPTVLVIASGSDAGVGEAGYLVPSPSSLNFI